MSYGLRGFLDPAQAITVQPPSFRELCQSDKGKQDGCRINQEPNTFFHTVSVRDFEIGGFDCALDDTERSERRGRPMVVRLPFAAFLGGRHCTPKIQLASAEQSNPITNRKRLPDGGHVGNKEWQ